MSANQFRARDFLNTLHAGSLPLILQYTGLMKADEGSADTLLFSMNSCQSWIQLHHDAIESIEYLGMAGCNDHEHAMVTIEVKQPTTPEGLAIAKLSDHARLSTKRVGAIAEQTEYDPAGCGSCLSECTGLHDAQARKACITACNQNACR